MSRRHYSRGRGEGHREADPAALADLVSDGGAATRHGDRDPAGRRGLLGHDRGRVRAPLLRRPRGARRARHPAARRQAGRGLLRAGELLARARGLPPPRDRLHRRGARVAADRAEAARRRVRLRRAAAPGAAADHLGAPEPAGLARAALDRARHHRVGRRRRGLRPPGQDRHRDLPPQADRVRVLHDAVRGGRAAPRRPLPARLPGRPVLPRGPLARARRRARVPALAHPRQGRLRHQGRARLPAPGGLRPARLRQPHPVAARGHEGDGGDLGVGPHRLARRAQLRPLRRDGRRRGRRRPRLPHGLLDPPARDRVGARLRRARPHRGPAGARGRGARAARQDHRAPQGRTDDERRRGQPARRRRPRGRRAADAARARRPRSGPSASPASSRSPRC